MSAATHSPACFDSVASVLAAVGRELGATDWVAIDQQRIDTFAQATGDHQWIHVDPERAKTGPFGACVAHGYLTLSLANLFLPQLVSYQRLKMGVNYGCDKVRFPAPVRVGSRIRGRGDVITAEAIKGDGVQVTVRITVEIDGTDKPGCVVDTISRLYFE
ncbi:MAG: MaoC family dehydratase [Pseudomonadota bacterium]|nr:MaoC family dehydratase [Pseudomonadota bacterium]